VADTRWRIVRRHDSGREARSVGRLTLSRHGGARARVRARASAHIVAGRAGCAYQVIHACVCVTNRSRAGQCLGCLREPRWRVYVLTRGGYLFLHVISKHAFRTRARARACRGASVGEGHARRPRGAISISISFDIHRADKYADPPIIEPERPARSPVSAADLRSSRSRSSQSDTFRRFAIIIARIIIVPNRIIAGDRRCGHTSDLHAASPRAIGAPIAR